MKNVFFALAFMLGTFAFANTSEIEYPEVTFEYYEASCTVSYTNSHGVTFTATAETCTEAYELISPHIEAK